MFDPLAPAPKSLATIASTHDLAHGGREDEPASAYGMFVPKRWACATAFSGVTSGLGVPEPLGAFLLEPSPQSPAVLVTMCRFGAEIGVEDFLRYRSTCDGWTVRDTRWTAGLHGPRLQVAAARGTDVPELRVTTAIVDNARLFLVEAVAQERWWPELHARMWPCGLSFGLAAPTGVERLGRTRTVETAAFSFEAPEDWRVVVSKPRRAGLELRHRDRSLAWLGVERRAAPADVDRTQHVR
ncbi:MAG: hypothetical protein IAG13_35450, partial [Deltaproteobacteria bacterium]|nr:hypothetical protein [Nannocystaceae bacterium]